MNEEFNADAYRASLKEKLGIKNLPMQKKTDFVDTSASTVKEDIPMPTAMSTETETPGALAGGGEVGADPAESQASEEQLAPAMALIHTVLQVLDEQARGNTTDKKTDMMWRGLHGYIWKNRSKIAKKMMDDAQ